MVFLLYSSTRKGKSGFEVEMKSMKKKSCILLKITTRNILDKIRLKMEGVSLKIDFFTFQNSKKNLKKKQGKKKIQIKNSNKNFVSSWKYSKTQNKKK